MIIELFEVVKLLNVMMKETNENKRKTKKYNWLIRV